MTRKRTATNDAPTATKRVRLTDNSRTKASAKAKANTSVKIVHLTTSHKSRTKAKTTTGARDHVAEPHLINASTRKLRIYVFGEGSAGELGLGPKNGTEVATPRRNPLLDDVVNVACGGMHAAAITAEGRLLTWGVNDHKSLGRDTTWDGGRRIVAQERASTSDSNSEDGDLNPLEATPTAISADTPPLGAEIAQVAAGDSATFLLTRQGQVFGCGTFRDMNGGSCFSYDPSTRQKVEIQPVFTLIPALEKIKSLSVGADFALALDVDGHVFAWGVHQQNQLGRRVMERRSHEALIPTRVELPKKLQIVSIHTGIDHAFAIDQNRDTWAWGLNNFAQTGIADNAGEGEATVPSPRKVPSLSGKRMKMIHGGRHHSIGVTQSGECLVWGRMDGGQMGLDLNNLSAQQKDNVIHDERGRPRILSTPTALPIDNCVFATAGTDHCIAVSGDGIAWSWGFNVNYQCGQGTSDDVEVAKPIQKKSVRDVKFCWAGAGGQYSMLAAYSEDVPMDSAPMDPAS